MVLTYHFTLPLRAERRSLLIHIAVAEYCVLALLPFFVSALIRRLVEYFHVFEGTMDLTESGVLLLLPAGMHYYVVHVVYVAVFKSSQFNLSSLTWLTMAVARWTAKPRSPSSGSSISIEVEKSSPYLPVSV